MKSQETPGLYRGRNAAVWRLFSFLADAATASLLVVLRKSKRCLCSIALYRTDRPTKNLQVELEQLTDKLLYRSPH